MKRAGLYLVLGTVTLALVVAFLVYLGLPRNRATGSPLILLLLLGAGSLSYGLYLLASRAWAGPHFAWAGRRSRHKPTDGSLVDPNVGEPGLPGSDPPFGRKSASSDTGPKPAAVLARPLTIWASEVRVPEVSRLDFRIAGSRHLISPRLGLAVFVGHMLYEAGYTFPVTVYSHPKFVGLGSVPSISSKEYEGLQQTGLCALGPIGKWGLPRNLHMQASEAYRRNAPLHIVSPAGSRFKLFEVLADVTPFFFVLEHWRRDANGGDLPETITMPAKLAAMIRESMQR